MVTADRQVRQLLVQWRNDVDGVIYPVGVLERDERFRFFYLPRALELPRFRALPAFPELDQSYESDTLFDFFAVRVMDRRRPEYKAFLAALDLAPGADDLTVLARSGGRRRGDFVSVVAQPIVSDDGHTSHVFLVAGVRHVADHEARDRALATLQRGDALGVDTEPGNPVNSNALVVVTPDGGARLGWVPDGLVHYVRRLLDSTTLTLRVVRVNGPAQPDQLRLLVAAEGRLPEGSPALPQLLVGVR